LAYFPIHFPEAQRFVHNLTSVARSSCHHCHSPRSSGAVNDRLDVLCPVIILPLASSTAAAQAELVDKITGHAECRFMTQNAIHSPLLLRYESVQVCCLSGHTDQASHCVFYLEGGVRYGLRNVANSQLLLESATTSYTTHPAVFSTGTEGKAEGE
jgi:hypothetical protein